jgi:uncharacterized membrane protein
VDPFSPLRATTVHPALVHFTLGAAPVFTVAYAVSAWRRSQAWSFAGDAALWIGAASSVATVASGLLANALVPWPGGLEVWRWVHLAAGVASAAVFVGFAAVRWGAHRRGAIAGRGALAAAVVLAVMLGATGWIGGEVLVFHSGVAVAAAADGALAPTISRTRTPPADVEEAMGRMRGAWAEARTAHDHMLVERPTADGYARIAAAAGDLVGQAEWLERAGPAHFAAHGGPEIAAVFEQQAALLRERAVALQRAAAGQQWSGVTQALGAVTATCAGCHQATRWRADHVHGQEP